VSSQKVEIIEYTDPLCSIAWGTEPFKRRLIWRYGDRLSWRVVMAGLCGDNSKVKMFQPWNPYEAGQMYLKVWKRVNRITGMPYPENLRYMALTTDPTCVLVKAAERQGADIAERVLRRFREAVFLYGTPVDHIDQAALALEGIEGLDIDALLRDVDREEVRKAYLGDWEETRNPNDYVRQLAAEDADHLAGPMMKSEGHERYNLPTFIFRGSAGEKTVPGYRPYEEYEAALEEVSPGISDEAGADATPDEAIARWSTLTNQELELLCGENCVPSDNIAQVFDCGGAKVWMNSAESEYWMRRNASEQ
jgi:predicted DsbA family dithiol-disulfide isomerase